MNYSLHEWKTLIFSDEKKFNLDGLDGFAYYWRDINNEEISFPKRQNCGEHVMRWAACSYHGVSHLVMCHGKIDSEKYCDVLTRVILPFGAENLGENYTFQQDGASIHSSA